MSEESWEDGREVPEAREEVDCVVRSLFPSTVVVEGVVTDYGLFPILQDCYKWEFGDFKDSDAKA